MLRGITSRGIALLQVGAPDTYVATPANNANVSFVSSQTLDPSRAPQLPVPDHLGATQAS